MNRFVLIIVICYCCVSPARAQYDFYFINYTALTHIGSLDGPFAGPDIWAQAFAGATPEDLQLVGSPAQHSRGSGLVWGGLLTVPEADFFGTAYVQMYVWDGVMWGTDFSQVPAEWLGSTDVGTVSLGGLYGPPPGTPRFFESAIVPVVPEPSTVALAVIGGVLLFVLRRARCRKRDASLG